MSSVSKIGFDPEAGDQVVLVCQTDSRPIWTTGVVISASPFVVEVDARWTSPLQSSPNLVVIHDSGRCIARAHTRFADSVLSGSSARVAFEPFEWECVDCRDHPRFKMEVHASVRSTDETGDDIRMLDQVASTRNLSLGGALVEVGKPIQLGSLVEFRMAWNSFTIRAMGLVAHSNENGTLLGLNFIEYLGSSHEDLRGFLADAAA